jgi:uncharacterized protein YkwD
MRRTPLAALVPAAQALAGLSVLLLVLLVPVTAEASPASDYAAAAVKATNNAREANDRTAFKVDECLHGFAVKQARAMARAGEMYHQDLGPVMDECGLVAAGENVAYGFPTGRSVVNQGWMKSDGHRANILSRSFKLVAVAARRDGDGRWYAAQVFGRR